MDTQPPNSDACFVVAGAPARADVPVLCERLRALAAGHAGRGVDFVACDVGALVADLAGGEALVRLQLTAGRLGCRIRLRDASRELEALLALCGLAEVLPVEGARCEGRLAGTPFRG